MAAKSPRAFLRPLRSAHSSRLSGVALLHRRAEAPATAVEDKVTLRQNGVTWFLPREWLFCVFSGMAPGGAG